MRILVAEDETIIRLDLREILERAGYSVVAEARDGEEAVELAASEKPDLAILDVKMPKLDGIDAARRILTDRPIPIVILTAYGQDELVARAVEAGVFGYLVKPFRETDLLPAIRQPAPAMPSSRLCARKRSRSRRLCRRARSSSGRRASDGARGADRGRGVCQAQRASQVSGRPMRVVAEALIATFAEA